MYRRATTLAERFGKSVILEQGLYHSACRRRPAEELRPERRQPHRASYRRPGKMRDWNSPKIDMSLAKHQGRSTPHRPWEMQPKTRLRRLSAADTFCTNMCVAFQQARWLQTEFSRKGILQRTFWSVSPSLAPSSSSNIQHEIHVVRRCGNSPSKLRSRSASH